MDSTEYFSVSSEPAASPAGTNWLAPNVARCCSPVETVVLRLPTFWGLFLSFQVPALAAIAALAVLAVRASQGCNPIFSPLSGWKQGNYAILRLVVIHVHGKQ